MEIAESQTLEVKEKGKYLLDILIHTFYGVWLGDLQKSSSSHTGKDSQFLTKKSKTDLKRTKRACLLRELNLFPSKYKLITDYCICLLCCYHIEAKNSSTKT